MFLGQYKKLFQRRNIPIDWKLRNKETRNSISKISEVSEFLIYHFFSFQKKNEYYI